MCKAFKERIKVDPHCRSDQLDHPDQRKFPTKPDQAGLKRDTRLLLDLLSITHDPHTTHSRRPLNHPPDFLLIISTYTRAVYDLSSTKKTSAQSPPDLRTTRS
ncbi:hypothetical protein DPMN_147341 [Dreissena polymorpha]|uniref:Uncharacterized protein n=1 Tax=Dreissena polymorpha TaxID=45954 RepID=A0A9D4J2W6_DREPO|nr:hypothetical protein DPMN_147341 [Dreissena polymorpha]